MAVATALVGAAAAAVSAPWQAVPLVAWDAGAAVWVAAVWIRVAKMDASQTRNHALNEEPRRPTLDLVVLTAAVISLVAVLLAAVKASGADSATVAVLLGAGVAAIVLSWATVHTLFTLRYAGLYYGENATGVDFNEDDPPCYLDFAYLSFTIGMTFQVSDTDITTKSMRHTALRHALLSYLFGAVIIATTINLVSGLVH